MSTKIVVLTDALGNLVNAGEILQRLAGVKVQHGRKQEGPRSGAFLLVAFHS